MMNNNLSTKPDKLDDDDDSSILNRIILTATETRETGIKTLLKLELQTEQLQKADESLDRIDQSLTRSQRLIRSMQSIFGSFGWRGTDNSLKKFENGSKYQLNKLALNNNQLNKLALNNNQLNKLALNDSQLDILSNILADMKILTCKQGEILDFQNEIIEKVTNKTDNCTNNIKKMNRNISAIC